MKIYYPKIISSEDYKNLNKNYEIVNISKNQKNGNREMTITILNELIQKYKDEADSLNSKFDLESSDRFREILELIEYIMDFVRRNKKELVDIDYEKIRKETKRKPLVPVIFEKEMKRKLDIDLDTKRLEF